jgi:hypothetical protein
MKSEINSNESSNNKITIEGLLCTNYADLFLGFLLSALVDFPAIDEDTKERKEDTVNRYVALLRKQKLAGEKTISKLTEERLEKVGIPLGHAVAIAGAAQKFGTKRK